MKQFLNFAIVGTIGFCVDATVLLIFVNILFFEIYIARIISFIIAVFVTWILNRVFTFGKSKYSKKREYSYYFIVQSIGAILNYIIFIALVKSVEFFEEYLIVPLGIASIIAMFFNFVVMKKRVFI